MLFGVLAVSQVPDRLSRKLKRANNRPYVACKLIVRDKHLTVVLLFIF